MRNFRGTFIALVVVGALVAYAYFYEYKKKNEQAEQKSQEQIVLKYQPEKVRALDLTRDDRHMVFQKDGGVWKMSQPVSDLADTSTLTSLITSLANEKSEQVVVEGASVDFSKFGLDHPKSTLKVTLDDGQILEVSIGTMKTIDGKLYARIGAEQRVLLVGGPWDYQLDQQIKNVRNKKVWRAEGAGDTDLLKIERQHAGRKEVVELNKEKDRWKLKDDDSGFPVSNEIVQTYLEQLRGLQVQEFVSESKAPADLRKYGLATPALSVQMSANNAPWGLQVAAHVEEKKKKGDTTPPSDLVYATSTDLPGIVQLSKSLFASLQKENTDFYDRKYPFQYNLGEATTIKVKTLHLNFEAKKDGGGWRLADSNSQKTLDSAKFNELLDRVSKFEVSRFVAFATGSEKAQGLSPAKNQLLLLNRKGETVFEMIWGGTFTGKVDVGGGGEQKIYYTKTNRVARVFGLTEASIEGLKWKELVVDKVVGGAPQTQTSLTEKTSESVPKN